MEDAKLYFAQKEQRWYNTAFIFIFIFFHAISCPGSLQIHIKGGSSRKHLGLLTLRQKPELEIHDVMNKLFGCESSMKWWIGGREWSELALRWNGRVEWQMCVSKGQQKGRGTGGALNSSCKVFRSQSEILARQGPTRKINNGSMPKI